MVLSLVVARTSAISSVRVTTLNAADLVVPENITLASLPPYASELNPIENVLPRPRVAAAPFNSFTRSDPSRGARPIPHHDAAPQRAMLLSAILPPLRADEGLPRRKGAHKIPIKGITKSDRRLAGSPRHTGRTQR
jgi:hypothetical protein